jgi:hypothetical protein
MPPGAGAPQGMPLTGIAPWSQRPLRSSCKHVHGVHVRKCTRALSRGSLQLQIKQQKKQEASKHPSRPAAAAYINTHTCIYVCIYRHGSTRRAPQVETGRRRRSGRSELAAGRVGGAGRSNGQRFWQVDTTSLSLTSRDQLGEHLLSVVERHVFCRS